MYATEKVTSDTRGNGLSKGLIARGKGLREYSYLVRKGMLTLFKESFYRKAKCLNFLKWYLFLFG